MALGAIVAHLFGFTANNGAQTVADAAVKTAATVTPVTVPMARMP